MKKLLLLLLFLPLLASAQDNSITDASNNPVTVTNYLGGSSLNKLKGLPLGTADDSATGEVVVKTKAVGGSLTIAGTSLTPTINAKVASGTVSAGCRQITFIASSDFVGTILTNYPITAGSGLTITAPTGCTIGAIAFTRSAGTLFTVELR